MRQFAFAMVVALGACGSSGPKYTIDDSVLAQVPTADKNFMLAAQQERSIAQDQVLKAKADAAQADRDVDVADNEYSSSKLQVDSAEVQKKSAEATGDFNRKTAAEHDVRVAELAKDAAASKLDWAKERRSWLRAELDAAELNVEAANAKYELEKARLASAKGIRPSADFNVANYERESLERTQKYSQAKLDADKKQSAVEEAERKYRSRHDEWARSRGDDVR
jgi:hypothetical protein